MAREAFADGIIEHNKAYSLRVFQQLTGMKAAAMRRARLNGLPVRRVGVHSFVLGSDWIKYLQEHGKIVGKDV